MDYTMQKYLLLLLITASTTYSMNNNDNMHILAKYCRFKFLKSEQARKLIIRLPKNQVEMELKKEAAQQEIYELSKKIITKKTGAHTTREWYSNTTPP